MKFSVKYGCRSWIFLLRLQNYVANVFRLSQKYAVTEFENWYGIDVKIVYFTKEKTCIKNIVYES